ncbi:MmgE/PrpD family protein [Paradesulfitobacterium ferrireducens]|uniref:MmgE/PrpD family protein n=1 Tax=Paradesulfitobacterium ferrireducens TaxID=2816476 RepID=UPI001A8D9CDE|nr:MmgE/PrpD family protein [Paradesulfitobacterium ferrireducens]
MSNRMADIFAKFIKETTFESIPSETVRFTKEFSLKTLAGIVAGSATGAGKPIVNYLKDTEISQDAGVIGSKFKSSLEGSILANGHFAHAAELEDDQFPSATSDITIVPVIFPLAEKLGISGREIIEATAVASEVMNRIGMFSLAYKGITDLPFFGIIGAAVAAAKALKLDENQIKNAIGIAIGRASGYIENFGTDAHYFESSMACRDGYFAAIMAQKGLTGTWNLEKWLKQLHDQKDLPIEEIVKDLGEPRWHTHNFWIKKYPCCFLTHRQIDIMFAIKEKHELTPDNIELIEIDAGPVDATCDRPSPKHIEDSRFSFQHIMAGILIDGDVSYNTFTVDKINDPAFQKMREKVRVIHRDFWKPEFNSGIARVSVRFTSGEVIEKTAEQPLGGSKNPLTQDQFLELYKKYTKGFLSDRQIQETAKMILELEEQPNVSQLMHILTFG